MKKIISFFSLLLFLFSIFPSQIHASDTGYFIVTAYYSPLPDQDYYITGSYEQEKRLNGNGIAGASGKNVFSGMLAAPAKYGFGTKIELDGLGIGSVDDRGGAIVPAGERGYGHDRIDVWVGYGDEGLRRAMYWGKRKIEGKVISNNSPVTLDYNSIPTPTWAVPKTTLLYGNKVQVFQDTEASVVNIIDVFGLSLGKGSDSSFVTQLQNILKEIGYYTQSIATGEYDSHTIDAVYNFQVNNEIVLNELSKGAGSYGPKTREKLKELYSLYLEEEKIKEEKIAAIDAYKIESKDIASQIIESIGTVSYGDISPQVRQLQKMLNETGYFDYKDTAIFGVKTRNALLNFQLENAVIDNINESGAGIFGPKTKEFLSLKIGEQNFREILELEGLQGLYDSLQEIDTEVINEQEEIATENIIYSI